jgi:hypothetical protein
VLKLRKGGKIWRRSWERERLQLFRAIECNILPKIFCTYAQHLLASYRFKQNNNVLYLTGLSEPDSVVLMEEDRLLLFRKPEDEHQLLWEGPKTDEGRLKQQFGFHEVQIELNNCRFVIFPLCKAILKKGRIEHST